MGKNVILLGTVVQPLVRIITEILRLVTVVVEPRARLVEILLRDRANLVVTKDPLRSLFKVLLIHAVVCINILVIGEATLIVAPRVRTLGRKEMALVLILSRSNKTRNLPGSRAKLRMVRLRARVANGQAVAKMITI